MHVLCSRSINNCQSAVWMGRCCVWNLTSISILCGGFVNHSGNISGLILTALWCQTYQPPPPIFPYMCLKDLARPLEKSKPDPLRLSSEERICTVGGTARCHGHRLFPGLLFLLEIFFTYYAVVTTLIPAGHSSFSDSQSQGQTKLSA